MFGPFANWRKLVRLEAGAKAPTFRVETIEGTAISLDGFAGKPLMLMFYRYASCPMCNLRLHDFALEAPRLRARGLEVVAFFHSSARRVRAAAGERPNPLHLGGDPTYTVYRAYGVETSWPRLLLSMALPSFYVDWVRSMRHGFWGGVDVQLAKMPADFLIGPNGRIARAHYGGSIGDHLSVGDVDSFLDSV
jgi:peroxiredoxin